MAIEFNCKFCGKILRTGDDKAGRQAKCPSCGETILVPDSSADGSADDVGDDASTAVPATQSKPKRKSPKKKSGSRGTSARAKARDYVDDVDEYDDYEDDYDEYDDEPPRRRPVAKKKPCPVCGGPVTARDDDCPHCGEDLYAVRQSSQSRSRSSSSRRRGGRSSARSADRDYSAGEIIGDAWALFTEEMGTFVGGTIISGILGTVLYFGCYLFFFLVVGTSIAALGGGRGFGGEAGVQIGATVIITGVVAIVVYLLGMAFLHLGLRLMFFNVVSGKGSDFGDLFRGGPYLGRFIVASFLFSLMYFIGAVLLFIPAIIVLVMFWPYEYALFDRDSGGVGCLGDAKQATDGQWGTIILLGLAAFGINIAGALACGVGMLFSIPFTYAIFAVAYCRMAGVRVDL